MKRTILLLVLVVALMGVVLANDLYPTTISDLNTTARLHGYGSVSNLKSGEEVTFQTLTFQDSQFQKVEILKEALYINGKTIKPTYFKDEFGNKYVEFKIKDNGDFNYDLVAKVQTSARLHPLTDYNLSDVPTNIKMYTAPSEKVESDSTEIMTLAKSKLAKKSFLATLEDTISWVNGYVEYAQGTDFQRYYVLQRSAVETLVDKKGVCDEFSNLAAALLRAKGVPTRLAIGITYDGEQWGNHAWIEVYHKDLDSWIPSDPTFRETGFVDGTHIKIGAFSDVSLSLAKALFPKTATIYFQTQTMPEVTIEDKAYFEDIIITSLTSELKANQWNDYKINIENNTNHPIIAPVRIKENYKDILVEEKTKGIALNARQSAETTFKIYPKIDLENTETARGTITFNTLNAPYDKNFTIVSALAIDNGKITILDITPIATKSYLELVITVGNYRSEEQKVDINVFTDTNSYLWQEIVPPFSEQTYKKDMPFYEEKEHTIVANTLTEQYTQYVYPTLEKTQVIDTTTTQTITVTQKIDLPKQGTIETFTQKPEMVLIILLAGVAVLLLALFLTRKRYV